jgi:hypothetical protein
MLKRLLGRGKTSEQAALAPASPDVSEPDVAEVAKTPAAAPVLTPKRGTKSMRDSDIKDELGRSAEQIAAEAAQEFDIDAVVRKAAAMPDVVLEKTVAKAIVADIPAPNETAQQPHPTVQTPPLTATPAATPKARVTVEGGHIQLPSPSVEAIVQTRNARAAYWDAVGVSDVDFLGYPVSPQVLGMPAWPTQTQRFRVIRTANSLIIASEGLSDPFGTFDTRGQGNGFGVEVFLEICGGQELSAEDIRKTWAFKAVEHVARIFAFGQDLGAMVHDNDVLSVDLPSNCVPAGWIVPGVAEPAGALLNIGQPSGRVNIAGMPLGPVRAVPLTPIYPEELESCLIEGASERRALANDLLTTGIGHRMKTSRTSLR